MTTTLTVYREEVEDLLKVMSIDYKDIKIESEILTDFTINKHSHEKLQEARCGGKFKKTIDNWYIAKHEDYIYMLKSKDFIVHFVEIKLNANKYAYNI